MKRNWIKMMVIMLLGALVFSAHIKAALTPGDSPDSDPFYDIITKPNPEAAFLNDTGVSAGGNATITHHSNNGSISIDYNMSKVTGVLTPAPNEIYDSTATITNNTNHVWKLDANKSMQIFLYNYFTPGSRDDNYAAYKKIMDQYLMFKFNMIGPDGTIVNVSPYAVITDYSSSANYYFPDEASSRISLSDSSSIDGPNYAKATLMVPDIILKPGESLQVPWWFGTSFYSGYKPEKTDFNFRFVFNQMNSYTVNYYQDSVKAANLFGSKSGITQFDLNHQLIEADVTTDLGVSWLNAYQPSGYSSGRVNSYPIISVDDINNVVNVIYVKIPVPNPQPEKPTDDTKKHPKKKKKELPKTGQQDLFMMEGIILLLGGLVLTSGVLRKKL